MAPYFQSQGGGGLAPDILPCWAVRPSERHYLLISRVVLFWGDVKALFAKHNKLRLDLPALILLVLSMKCRDARRVWKQLRDMFLATMPHLVFPSRHNLPAAGTEPCADTDQYLQLPNSGVNIAVMCRVLYTVQIC